MWSVINNAGIVIPGPLDWQSLDQMKKIADVNLWGLIDVTKMFLPLLKKSGGRLVNVASIGGEILLCTGKKKEINSLAQSDQGFFYQL